MSNNPDKRKEKDLPPEGDAPLDHDLGTRSLRSKKDTIPGPTLKDRIKKITGELDAKTAEQAAQEAEKIAPAKTPPQAPPPADKQPSQQQPAAKQPPPPQQPAPEKPAEGPPSAIAGTQQSLTLRMSQIVKELPEAVMPYEVPAPPETPTAQPPDRPVQPAAERKKKTGELKPLPKAEVQEKADTSAAEDIQPWQIMFQLMDATAKVLGTEVHRAMVVGRTDPTATNVQVDLDLADYEGAEHGVSRQHAILLPSAEGLWIVDLDSTNGTWINGLYLQPGMKYRLRTSDRVEFGTLELMIRVIGEVPLMPPDRSSPSATSISRRKPPKHG